MSYYDFSNQITTSGFADHHNFLVDWNGFFTAEKRDAWHPLRTKEEKDSQMLGGAKLIESMTEKLVNEPAEKLVHARANLVITRERMAKCASTTEAKEEIEQRLDRAIGNIAGFSPLPFFRSLFLGTRGAYRLFGYRIVYHESRLREHAHFPDQGWAPRLIDVFFRKFGRLTFASLHITIHEFGHALGARFFTNKCSTIDVSKRGGVTYQRGRSLQPWESSVVSAAGPLFHMAFSGCIVAAATLFRTTLTLPVGVAIGSNGVLWMAGELLYAYSSSTTGFGDFGDIAKNSAAHHALATAALIGQCALTLFACYKAL